MAVSDADRYELARLRVITRNVMAGRKMSVRELMKATNEELEQDDRRLAAEVSAAASRRGVRQHHS
jgi:hypothetical protein